LDIRGLEKIPKKDSLILIGNHSAIMEVVLMVIFPPRQIEVLGSIDVPHETLTNFISNLYGYIPYKRGFMDRPALRQSIELLNQGGCLGIFPEGGIWQTTERRILPGVAWLSEKTNSPVLPIYIAGTAGALNKAIRFKRPKLTMEIGNLIAPAVIPKNQLPKEYLKSYAEKAMDEVDKLRPPDDQKPNLKIRDEKYSLQIVVFSPENVQVEIPPHMAITHSDALAKFLHYPTILKIFKVNFRMPIEALQTLATNPTTQEINKACQLILEFLEHENPYLLTYRFGHNEGNNMRLGLSELELLTGWLTEKGYSVKITPIKKYFDLERNLEITQTEQGEIKNWM